MRKDAAATGAATCLRVRELGLKGRWQEALQLLEGLTPSEIDGVTYTASMWACVKSEQWEHAVRLFEEMQQQFRVHNDTVSCNAALCAYQQAGRWEDALKLLQEMQSSADVISYTACLNACADANQWAQAFAVHSSMLQGGVAATSSTCNAVVRSSRDGAAWKKQLQLLEEMRFRNLQPDAAALNAAASACSQAGEWRSALEMMSSMWQRALQPDDKAFCDVIDVCGRCGQWQEALRIFDLHRATALAPCAAVHAAAMRACGGARWPMALQLLEQLWETQTPDVACYEAALHCCEEARAWTEVERLYEEMLSYNLEPGEVSDKAVAAAVATTGNWERGLKLLEKRQDSAEVIGNVARACAEGHQWQKVLELLEEDFEAAQAANGGSFCHLGRIGDPVHSAMIGIPVSKQWVWPLRHAIMTSIQAGEWQKALDNYRPKDYCTALQAEAEAKAEPAALEVAGMSGPLMITLAITVLGCALQGLYWCYREDPPCWRPRRRGEEQPKVQLSNEALRQVQEMHKGLKKDLQSDLTEALRKFCHAIAAKAPFPPASSNELAELRQGQVDLSSQLKQVQDLLATDVLVKRLRYQDAEEVVLNDSV
ncbi:Pentatricopeptide repeat-containing protein 10 [Durusdinium trenchii]|uniref:Chloroplastic (ZmPPR10) n=1 Tax=Durusdinium trenchii TaxID=1381693 RepID=A0ABP0MQJ2_9DINO